MTMTRIPFLRAINNDRLLLEILDSVLSRQTTLSQKVRQSVCQAFRDANLLKGTDMRAADAGFDAKGQLAVKDVDRALAHFDGMVRAEIKNVLARYGALAR